MVDKKYSITSELVGRFSEKFVAIPIAGCWIWTAAVNEFGYGRFFVEWRCGRSVLDKAHRVSWRIYKGEIPDGFGILHHCDVPCCVNPSHLFVGTQKDNVADRLSKNRPKTGARGERHPRALLNDDLVVSIRRNFSGLHGEITDIAKKYSVSESTINSIISGRTWRHIQM